MSDETAKNIPTLDDVVEIGNQEDEESIRIVAESDDGIEDAYDDEFNKLFEPAAEQQNIDLNHETVSDDDLWDDSGMQMAEQETTAVTDTTAEVASEDLNDISITATSEPVELEAENTESNDMWLQDWQEEIVESAVIDNMDNDVDISHDHPADVSIEPEQPAAPETATILKAVQQDPEITEAAAATTSSSVSVEADDIPALVNDIVTQVMPEIEWKLRNRIREILEERFPPED